MAIMVFVCNLPVQAGWFPAELPPGTGVMVAIGLCLPYVVRRDFPLATFGTIATAFLVQLMLGVIFLPADVVVFCALYNVAARCERRTSVAAAGVVTCCALLAAYRENVPFLAVSGLLTTLVLIVSVWVWGSMIGIRRAYVASLQERAVQLEKERDNQARIAAAAERSRIAREIHDTVSHSLSAVIVLAKGAGLNVQRDPDLAEHALQTVERTGRDALADMRRMLNVLRDTEPGSHAPQPGVAQLGQLVADARNSGLPVEFAVHGVPRTLAESADLAVYRVIQEGLTNARKHAGPNVTRVEVQLQYHEEHVEVNIFDDGRGPTEGPREVPGGGHGLVGVHERIEAYGGALRTGRRTDGGFEVMATLPLGRAQ